MKKKLSASSQPERLVRKTLDDIRKTPLTEKQLGVLRRIADEQARGDDSNIDYSDIPEITDEQWAHAVRLRDIRPKVAISVRIEPRVLEWLKAKGAGHLTRINDILVDRMEAERRAGK